MLMPALNSNDQGWRTPKKVALVGQLLIHLMLIISSLVLSR